MFSLVVSTLSCHVDVLCCNKTLLCHITFSLSSFLIMANQASYYRQNGPKNPCLLCSRGFQMGPPLIRLGAHFGSSCRIWFFKSALLREPKDLAPSVEWQVQLSKNPNFLEFTTPTTTSNPSNLVETLIKKQLEWFNTQMMAQFNNWIYQLIGFILK